MNAHRLAFRLLAPFVGLVASLSASGCWVESDPAPQVVVIEPDPQPEPDPDPVVPKKVAIATGATLTSEAGTAFGVYVEYHGDGEWLVWATCDTANSGLVCHYQLDVTPLSGSSITDTTITRDEKNVSAGGPLGQGETASTSLVIDYETAGFLVHTTGSGLPIQVTATLDGDPDPKMLYWVGPDVIHLGGPTDPLIFEPTAP